MATWREYPNRAVMARRNEVRRSIGDWPGDHDPLVKAVATLDTMSRGARGAILFRHLGLVWRQCREDVIAQGATIEVADLAMASTLANHVIRCQLCQTDGGRGSSWMLWSAGRRPGLRLVVGSVLREVTGVRMPLPWELPGVQIGRYEDDTVRAS